MFVSCIHDILRLTLNSLSQRLRAVLRSVTLSKTPPGTNCDSTCTQHLNVYMHTFTYEDATHIQHSLPLICEAWNWGFNDCTSFISLLITTSFDALLNGDLHANNNTIVTEHNIQNFQSTYKVKFSPSVSLASNSSLYTFLTSDCIYKRYKM